MPALNRYPAIPNHRRGVVAVRCDPAIGEEYVVRGDQTIEASCQYAMILGTTKKAFRLRTLGNGKEDLNFG
jgi:hypothetical protein